MIIKNTFVNFIGDINVGQLALFVNLDKEGFFMEDKELVQKISFFDYVVLHGKPFEQKEDLPIIIRKAKKLNEKIIFEIRTDGLIKPVGINGISNVFFIINVQLKNTGKDYKDRININVLSWFNELGVKFKFKINNIDDLDESSLLINNIGIDKSRIYICVNFTSLEMMEKLVSQIKISGYNISMNFHELFWNRKR